MNCSCSCPILFSALAIVSPFTLTYETQMALVGETIRVAVMGQEYRFPMSIYINLSDGARAFFDEQYAIGETAKRMKEFTEEDLQEMRDEDNVNRELAKHDPSIKEARLAMQRFLSRQKSAKTSVPRKTAPRAAAPRPAAPAVRAPPEQKRMPDLPSLAPPAPPPPATPTVDEREPRPGSLEWINARGLEHPQRAGWLAELKQEEERKKAADEHWARVGEDWARFDPFITPVKEKKIAEEKTLSNNTPPNEYAVHREEAHATLRQVEDEIADARRALFARMDMADDSQATIRNEEDEKHPEEETAPTQLMEENIPTQPMEDLPPVPEAPRQEEKKHVETKKGPKKRKVHENDSGMDYKHGGPEPTVDPHGAADRILIHDDELVRRGERVVKGGAIDEAANLSKVFCNPYFPYLTLPPALEAATNASHIRVPRGYQANGGLVGKERRYEYLHHHLLTVWNDLIEGKYDDDMTELHRSETSFYYNIDRYVMEPNLDSMFLLLFSTPAFRHLFAQANVTTPKSHWEMIRTQMCELLLQAWVRAIENMTRDLDQLECGPACAVPILLNDGWLLLILWKIQKHAVDIGVFPTESQFNRIMDWLNGEDMIPDVRVCPAAATRAPLPQPIRKNIMLRIMLDAEYIFLTFLKRHEEFVANDAKSFKKVVWKMAEIGAFNRIYQIMDILVGASNKAEKDRFGKERVGYLIAHLPNSAENHEVFIDILMSHIRACDDEEGKEDRAPIEKIRLFPRLEGAALKWLRNNLGITQEGPQSDHWEFNYHLPFQYQEYKCAKWVGVPLKDVFANPACLRIFVDALNGRQGEYLRFNPRLRLEEMNEMEIRREEERQAMYDQVI